MSSLDSDEFSPNSSPEIGIKDRVASICFSFESRERTQLAAATQVAFGNDVKMRSSHAGMS